MTDYQLKEYFPEMPEAARKFPYIITNELNSIQTFETCLKVVRAMNKKKKEKK